jgi:hypothetical protein
VPLLRAACCGYLAAASMFRVGREEDVSRYRTSANYQATWRHTEKSLASSAALCGPHGALPRNVSRLVSSLSKTVRSEERHYTDEAAPAYSSLRLVAVPNLLHPCTTIRTKSVHTHMCACAFVQGVRCCPSVSKIGIY